MLDLILLKVNIIWKILITKQESQESSKKGIYSLQKYYPRKVLIHDRVVNLTTKEYDLLEYFLVNKDRVIQKNAIVEHLWGDNADQFDNFDFIYNHVKNLRKKLLELQCNDYIKSIYGIGYSFKTIL